jgi:hypothetical protein
MEIRTQHVQPRRSRECTLELLEQRAPSREPHELVEWPDARRTPTGNAIGVAAPRHVRIVRDRSDGLLPRRVTFDVVQSRFVLIGVAIVFAAIDLADKFASHAAYHHPRSPLVAAVIVIVIAGIILFVPRVASRAALLGAAVATGGALGNLMSLFVWSQGVPDPFVVHGTTHDIAFNLADVFAVAGDAVLLAAVMLHGMRRRERLHERV